MDGKSVPELGVSGLGGRWGTMIVWDEEEYGGSGSPEMGENRGLKVVTGKVPEMVLNM